MALKRISGRVGQVIDLDVNFRQGGILTDPYAIRYVEIYKTSVVPHNLVVTIPVVDYSDSTYPSPISREYVATEAGECCTEPAAATEAVAGKYHLLYSVPTDFTVPDVYYDVWYWFPTNPCGDLGTDDPTSCDIDHADYAGFLQSCCHKFWLYPDNWFCGDSLQTINFGFEPLNNKFHSPEVRPLEVSLMPLPLYDYNFNEVNPIMPYLTATITVQTMYHELVIDRAAMSIGLRQGSYRSNPYTLKYTLDTTTLLKGTYQYYIAIAMPDGTSRVSRRFNFTIS